MTSGCITESPTGNPTAGDTESPTISPVTDSPTVSLFVLCKGSLGLVGWESLM